MNQILYVDKPKKGFNFNFNFNFNVDIKLLIVTICMIIFAIFIIIRGVSGFSTESTQNNGAGNVSSKNEPVVLMKDIDGKVQISISHNKAIDKIIYTWNNGQETILQGKGQNEITEIIEMPVGKNTLYVKVIDINKKEVEYSEEYYRIDKDITKPVIELILDGSKVKIIARDETEISYMMYHWDDEEDTLVEVNQDYKFEIEERIPILKGEHVLTVVAVDANGNEAKKEQLYKGAKKPEVEIIQENDELVITIKDSENIQKIEYTFNGEFFSTDVTNTGEPLNLKEAQIKQKMIKGKNTITVTAYNVSGLSKEETKEFTLQ